MERRQLERPDGVTITYWLGACGQDDAPLLLFIHGLASNHTRFSELIDHTWLDRCCDLVAPDLRGNGESMTRKKQNLRIWADDLAAILGDLGRREAILVGHSLGGQIAFRFAQRHQDRVQAMVLIDPVVRSALRGPRRIAATLSPVARAIATVGRLIGALGLGRKTFPARDLRRFDEESRQELAKSTDPDALAKKYTSPSIQLRYMPRVNYLQQLTASVEHLPPLEEMSAPTLVLLPSASTVGDDAIARRELSRMPDADLVEIPADHWPLTEKPLETRVAIEDWLVSRGLVRRVSDP